MTPFDGCFKCHCCGGLPDNGMDSKLIDLLNEITGLTGDDINCGYRCPKHNKEVGGVPNSQHVDGTAVDIDASKWGVEELAKICEHLQADGVGRYFNDNFVHCDTRSGRCGDDYRW